MAVHKQRRPAEVFWPKIVLKKWLNLRSKDLEFAADKDDDGSDIEDEDNCDCGDAGEALRRTGGSGDVNDENLESAPYKLRRRNSETLRAQYINTKELRVRVGTWNAGGKAPPSDLDIAEWLGTGEPADIYVLGFQEVVPLNAGNVFGAEDGRPAQAWESLIRGALRRAQPSAKPKYRCYSHPPSPSRFDPSNDAAAADAADELLPGGTDTETDDTDDDDVPSSLPAGPFAGATPRRLSRLNHFSFTDDSEELSRKRNFSLAWLGPCNMLPLDMLFGDSSLGTAVLWSCFMGCVFGFPTFSARTYSGIWRMRRRWITAARHEWNWLRIAATTSSFLIKFLQRRTAQQMET